MSPETSRKISQLIFETCSFFWSSEIKSLIPAKLNPQIAKKKQSQWYFYWSGQSWSDSKPAKKISISSMFSAGWENNVFFSIVFYKTNKWKKSIKSEVKNSQIDIHNSSQLWWWHAFTPSRHATRAQSRRMCSQNNTTTAIRTSCKTTDKTSHTPNLQLVGNATP